jgi:hypothetical protein
MTVSYAGFDCLTIEPNLVTQRGVTIARAVEGFTSPTGNVVTATTTAPAVSSFTLEWGCLTRADLNTLTGFLDRRMGRFSPCWIPTYQHDLNVTSSNFVGGWHITPGSAVDVVTLIPTVPSWRHWTMIRPGVARYFTYRVLITDLGGGVYSVDSGTTAFILPTGPWTPFTTSREGIFSRLMLCRMASDAYRVRYLGQASTVSADFIEVPTEAPPD